MFIEIGSVPGEVAKRFPYIFAGPVAKIFNRAIQLSEWPESWKEELFKMLIGRDNGSWKTQLL